MVLFFTILHVVLCVFMIFVILLQPGKDAGMGAALGGGAATSAFGGRGAVTFLSKVTGICAALFFITSLGLSFVGLRSSVAATGLPPAATAPAPVGAAGAADAGVAPEAAAPNTLTVEQGSGAAPATPVEAAPTAPAVPGANVGVTQPSAPTTPRTPAAPAPAPTPAPAPAPGSAPTTP